MNTTHKQQEESPAILSFSRKRELLRELLSPQGIAVSRVAEILWKQTQSVSSVLKKIQSRKHFSEGKSHGTTRIIVLTNAWVRELLERSKPTISKKTNVPPNVLPIKPIESGMFLSDFQKKLSAAPDITQNLATKAWNYLLDRHFRFFTSAPSPKYKKPVYKLKDIHKEEAIRLAWEYLQREGKNITKTKGGNTPDNIHQRTVKYFSNLHQN